MPRICASLPNSFCYICGEFTVAGGKCSITLKIKKFFHNYFGIKLGDQDKDFAPHVACISCVSKLRMWYQTKPKRLSFGIPMVWREQENHHNNCYYKKNKSKIKYNHLKSARRPVPHCDEIPVPKSSAYMQSSSKSESKKVQLRESTIRKE